VGDALVVATLGEVTVADGGTDGSAFSVVPPHADAAANTSAPVAQALNPSR